MVDAIQQHTSAEPPQYNSSEKKVAINEKDAISQQPSTRLLHYTDDHKLEADLGRDDALLAAPRFRQCLCFVVGYLNTLGLCGGFCSINWGGALMLTSAVSISKDGNWTATTGEVYAVFLGIHILQGILGSLTTRVLARL